MALRMFQYDLNKPSGQFQVCTQEHRELSDAFFMSVAGEAEMNAPPPAVLKHCTCVTTGTGVRSCGHTFANIHTRNSIALTLQLT